MKYLLNERKKGKKNINFKMLRSSLISLIEAENGE